jgi:hypothetical protein
VRADRNDDRLHGLEVASGCQERKVVKLKWDKWLYGLGSAIIGGGAGAVVSGFTSIILAPEQFNLTTGHGALKVVAAMGINFGVVGFFSMFFYLKQSPLPQEATGNTEIKTKDTYDPNQP